MRRPLLLSVLGASALAATGVVVAMLPAGAAAGFASTAVALGSGRCADIPYSRTTDGLQLIQYGCHGAANQSFTFTPVSGVTDQYTIKSDATGKCVDVYGVSTADNAAIIQWRCHSGNNQRFRLVPVTAGGTDKTFNLQAVHSDKCVAVTGASTAEGAKLVQLPCSSATDRVWRLASYASTTPPTATTQAPTTASRSPTTTAAPTTASRPPTTTASLPPVTGPAGTPPTGTVRVYWLRPSDVPYDQRWPDGIANVMYEAQRYYKQELGKTFKLNTVVVETVVGDHPRVWYETTPNGGDKYWWSVFNMQQELLRKLALRAPDARWVNVGEISAEGDGAGGGGGGGWVILCQHDADGAAGVRSEPMSRWYGGMIHELAHAFGLPDSSYTDGTPTSASFYSYPNVHFNQDQKNKILSGPYGSFFS